MIRRHDAPSGISVVLSILLLGIVHVLAWSGTNLPAQSLGFSDSESIGDGALIDAFTPDDLSFDTDGDGSWVVAWETTSTLGDTIGEDPDIVYVRSGDFGATWSAVAPLNTNAASDGTMHDLGPTVAWVGGEKWIAAWGSQNNFEDTLATDYDVIMSRSSDAGLTWSEPDRLYPVRWTDENYWGTQPRISYAKDDTLLCVLRLQAWVPPILLGETRSIYASTDNGRTWTYHANFSTGVRSCLLSSSVTGTSLIVYDVRRGGEFGGDGDVFFIRSVDYGKSWTGSAPVNTTAHTDTEDDYHPSVATNEAGEWVALWCSPNPYEGSGDDRDVVFARSTDDAKTWSPPALLSPSMRSDDYDDFRPDIACDDAGNWVAVWLAVDLRPGAPLGNDADVFVSWRPAGQLDWTYPLPLDGNARTDYRADFQPMVAADGAGGWLVFSAGHVPGGSSVVHPAELLIYRADALEFGLSAFALR